MEMVWGMNLSKESAIFILTVILISLPSLPANASPYGLMMRGNKAYLHTSSTRFYFTTDQAFSRIRPTGSQVILWTYNYPSYLTNVSYAFYTSNYTIEIDSTHAQMWPPLAVQTSYSPIGSYFLIQKVCNGWLSSVPSVSSSNLTVWVDGTSGTAVNFIVNCTTKGMPTYLYYNGQAFGPGPNAGISWYWCCPLLNVTVMVFSPTRVDIYYGAGGLSPPPSGGGGWLPVISVPNITAPLKNITISAQGALSGLTAWLQNLAFNFPQMLSMGMIGFFLNFYNFIAISTGRALWGGVPVSNNPYLSPSSSIAIGNWYFYGGPPVGWWITMGLAFCMFLLCDITNYGLGSSLILASALGLSVSWLLNLLPLNLGCWDIPLSLVSIAICILVALIGGRTENEATT
jgi:hypothetical protein